MKLSKGFKYSLIILLLVAGAFLIYDFFWANFDDYEALKTEFVSLKKKSAEDTRALAEFKAETIKAHELKDEKIASLKEDVIKVDKQKERLARVDEAKDLRIRELVKEREGLKDPKAVIINLESLVKAWEERFWNERRDKEESDKAAKKWSAIADLNLRKYLDEKKLREAVEKRLKDEIMLRKVSEAINEEGDKIIRSLSLKFNIKNALYTAGGFVFGVIVG